IDGIATGAIYGLVAVGTVLIFTVTRVTYIPFGDIAAFTALTLAALEMQNVPGTVGLVVILASLATVIELTALWRTDQLRSAPQSLFFYLVLPLVPAAIVLLATPFNPPMAIRILLAIAVIMPISPLLDR